MSRKIDISTAADWTDEEAAANLKYLDQRGDLYSLRQVLEARDMTWEEYTSVPDPEIFPQPDEDASDRTAQGSVPPVAVASDAASDVPDGTVDDVLDWVDDDPGRAAVALVAERAGKNRSSLIEALESISEEEG